MITTVRPLASFLTVIRFSKEAMSWAGSVTAIERETRASVRIRRRAIFMSVSEYSRVKRAADLFKHVGRTAARDDSRHTFARICECHKQNNVAQAGPCEL